MEKNMKFLTKLTPIAATLLLSIGTISVQADDKLTVSGFIDMSYLSIDVDGADSTHDSGIDQVELNLGYDFGNKLTATVDVEYQNNAEGVDVEQAFISYAVSEQFSVKAGRFLSYSGWETEEPTGLFQYSGAGYAPYFYGYYQQGVSGLYTGEGFSAAVSLVNDLAGPQSTDSEDIGVETMLAIMPSDDITLKGFYSFEKLNGTDEDTTLVNLWGSYSTGALTLAAEYNTSENAPAYVWSGAGIDSEASGFLLMGNYAFENFALTVRYHDWDIEDASGATFEDASGITISPSFSVNDNLLMVFEYRMDEINGVDVDSLAIEALITF
jgi:predicted porin